MSRLASLLCVAVLFSSFATTAHGQETASGNPPAHVALVDGSAVLERDGKTETAPTSMPLLAGDRLRTENGRIEVLFGDGSTLHVDTSSTVDIQSDEVIRLIQGRVRLNIGGGDRPVSYRVDAPAAWVEIQQPGEYRVAVDRGSNGQVELAVLRGSAELVNEDGRTRLRAGERAFASNGAAPSYAYVFNSANWDAFDQWSEARRDQRLGASAQYLPDTVRAYSSTFDSYGSWQYDTSYGYVWYPRVSVGWRPYYYGRWSGVYPWGWTWIGADPWAWPTHHFGRWGFSAGVWFWIPGRTWGPAWVSWAYAPGYVSWCPLGWDNRALFQINAFGGYRYDPWHAWTVVPHNRFGTGFVNVNVVAGSRIDPRTRGAFVAGRSAPDYRHSAVPRAAAPIYAAGTRAVTGQAGSIRTVNPENFDRSGTAVPRGSIGSRADVQNATETFRNRGRDAGAQGPGFPSASRTPRDSAVITTRGSQSAGVNRDQTPNGAPAAFDRRAVQRDGASMDRTNDSAPARRLEVPGFTRVPSSAVSPGDNIQPRAVQRNVTTPGGGSYAVPRASGPVGSAPRSDVSGPASMSVPRRSEGYVPREYPQQIDRGGWRQPEVHRGTPPESNAGGGGVRAVPRSAPEAGASRGYQPGPAPGAGYERSGPSGPPPSAAPSRSAAPSEGGGGGGGGVRSAQPRGGQSGQGGQGGRGGGGRNRG